MSRSKLVCLALAAVLILPLWGCGNNRGEGPASVQTQAPYNEVNLGKDAAGNEYLGANWCIQCHKDPSTLTSLVPGFVQETDLVKKFLGSKHVVHSADINAQSGADCLKCHSPVGDADAIASLLPAADVPSQGLAAVTCEACHGGGEAHFGLGPIPVPLPDYNVCGKCHNQTMPQSHDAHHPFGIDIVENYKASKHFESLDPVKGADGSVPALCSRCHTDEGFRQFAPQTLGDTADELQTALGSKAALTTVSPVQCRTCHDPHSGELRAQATTVSKDSSGTPITDTGANPISAQVFSASFNLCTTCHQVYLTYTWDAATQTFQYAVDPTKTAEHSFITDWAATHFGGTDSQGNTHQGFNINAADDRACLNCHDPHGTTKFTQANASAIATAWGNTAGGHGDYASPAFSDQQEPECAKCHSGSEFVKLTEGLPYSTTNADGSVTYNLAANQVRVVACDTCHDLTAKDSSGAFALGPRRTFKDASGNPTSIFTFPSGKTVDLSGQEDSELCVTCHSGRASGAAVDAAIAAGPRSDGTYKFVNIHYYAAAASFYGDQGQGGYEYPGKSYAGQFVHPPPALRTCIGCHMGSNANHTFAPDISECELCHGGTSIDTLGGPPGTLRDNIKALKDQLMGLLTKEGVTYSASYPYFGNLTTPAQLKAAYNWQFADKDPASFVHNGIYVEQLLYDSIADLGGTPSVSRPQ